jgi:regulator of sigma E protease
MDEPQEESVSQRELMINVLVLVGVIIASILWWDVFRNPVMFVVTLGILVAIHEWGHFIAAKCSGVRAYEFAIGMGPRILTYMRRGGTDYTIRALPIGGFVNLKGMQPDDPITPDGINGRRPAERALIYLSGPVMNMMLGVAILCLSGFLIGVPDESKAVVANVEKKSPASQMEVVSRNGQPAPDAKKGLQIGDYLLEVNGKIITKRDQVFGQVQGSANKTVTMRVRRGADEVVLTGVPGEKPAASEKFVTVNAVPEGTDLPVLKGDQIEQIDEEYVLDSLAKPGEAPDATVRRVLQEKAGKPITLAVWRNSRERLELKGTAGPLDVSFATGKRFVGVLGFTPYPGQGPQVSLSESVTQGLNGFRNFLFAMASMFSKPKQLSEGLGGPVAIWVMLGQVGKLPPMYYFNVMASLSLSLAIFNLLPIFVLDGGHMLLLTIEVLRRRRLEPEYQKMAFLVGAAIVGVLFVLILSKDLMKVIG